MPYKSQAQRRLFHYLQEKGQLSKKTVDEFDQASKGKKLPQHLAYGGDVEDPEDGMMDDYMEDPEEIGQQGPMPQMPMHEMLKEKYFGKHGRKGIKKDGPHGRVKMAHGGAVHHEMAKAIMKKNRGY